MPGSSICNIDAVKRSPDRAPICPDLTFLTSTSTSTHFSLSFALLGHRAIPAWSVDNVAEISEFYGWYRVRNRHLKMGRRHIDDMTSRKCNAPLLPSDIRYATALNSRNRNKRLGTCNHPTARIETQRHATNLQPSAPPKHTLLPRNPKRTHVPGQRRVTEDIQLFLCGMQGHMSRQPVLVRFRRRPRYCSCSHHLVCTAKIGKYTN